jgi:hypothetical protein
MGAYEDGYQAGSLGAIGACLEDASQQAEYDRGFADAQAGRQPNPNAPMPSNLENLPYYQSSDPDAVPPPSMGPWDGTTGSGPEGPLEFRDYEEPPEPYVPEVVEGD